MTVTSEQTLQHIENVPHYKGGELNKNKNIQHRYLSDVFYQLNPIYIFQG